jgi:hypothetical protein
VVIFWKKLAYHHETPHYFKQRAHGAMAMVTDILSGQSIFEWGVQDVNRNIMSFRYGHGFLGIIFYLNAKTML